MKMSAPNCSVTGSQASVQMKLSPKSWIAGHARSKTFQAMSPRSTVAASAAAMAIPLKSDVAEPNAAAPEIGLRRRGGSYVVVVMRPVRSRLRPGSS